MNKNMKMGSLFALTGVFLPCNSTISLLNYKHLRILEFDIDVLAMHTQEDAGLLKNMSHDPMHNKFHVFYKGDYQHSLFTRDNLNIFKIVYNVHMYIKEAVRMSSKKEYNILYTSSLPNFTHLAGYRVKKKYPHLKWIASFSDAIKDTPFQKYYIKSQKSLKGKLGFFIARIFNENVKCQRVAFKGADLLVFVSEEQRDFMTGGKRDLIEKSIIVPFTYIKEWPIYSQLMETSEIESNELKTIVHFGNVYGLRRIDSLVQGIQLAKKRIPDLYKKLQIQHYGIMEKQQRLLVTQSGVDDVFKVYDRIPYASTLEKMKKADVLLMLDTFVRENEPQPYMQSKFVEYYLTNKPILSIANDNSPIARYLKGTEHINVNPDANCIADALIKAISLPNSINNVHQKYENEYVIKNTLVPLLDMWMPK